MNKKIIIIVLIAIIAIIVGTVFLNGLNSSFKDVDVAGMTFHIPEDYELVVQDGTNSYLWEKDDSKIKISVMTNSTFSNYKNYIETRGEIVQNTTIGGYSGFIMLDSDSTTKGFVFEKDGATVTVWMEPFSESNISKIIS